MKSIKINQSDDLIASTEQFEQRYTDLLKLTEEVNNARDAINIYELVEDALFQLQNYFKENETLINDFKVLRDTIVRKRNSLYASNNLLNGDMNKSANYTPLSYIQKYNLQGQKSRHFNLKNEMKVKSNPDSSIGITGAKAGYVKEVMGKMSSLFLKLDDSHIGNKFNYFFNSLGDNGKSMWENSPHLRLLS